MRIPLRSLLLDLLVTQARSKMPWFPRFAGAVRGRPKFIWLFEDEGTGGFLGFFGGGIATGEETEVGFGASVEGWFEKARTHEAGEGHFGWVGCDCWWKMW